MNPVIFANLDYSCVCVTLEYFKVIISGVRPQWRIFDVVDTFWTLKGKLSQNPTIWPLKGKLSQNPVIQVLACLKNIF